MIHFCSRFTEAREDIGSISINGTKVIPVSSARNLGVVFDKFLDFSSHINAICKSATFSIRNIGRLRKYLNQADTERLVHAFVTSKLDSCNSILFGLPSYQIEKLQRSRTPRPGLLLEQRNQSTYHQFYMIYTG